MISMQIWTKYYTLRSPKMHMEKISHWVYNPQEKIPNFTMTMLSVVAWASVKTKPLVVNYNDLTAGPLSVEVRPETVPAIFISTVLVGLDMSFCIQAYLGFEAILFF